MDNSGPYYIHTYLIHCNDVLAVVSHIYNVYNICKILQVLKLVYIWSDMSLVHLWVHVVDQIYQKDPDTTVVSPNKIEISWKNIRTVKEKILLPVGLLYKQYN